jgi:2-oxoglutarate dehydrogenase E2 component (dihydrolipoamide succinyltransferase)
MSVEVRVPSMGESVTTATVARWLKKAGEAVKVDEYLVALDSDKATVEVPCPVAGILENTLVAEGAEVHVGEVIALVREGAAAPAPSVAAAPAVVAAPAPEVLAGPAARRAAQEAGIDTSTVSGTGKGGRVTREDVENASRKPEVAATPAPVKTAAPAAPVILAGDEPEEVVPMTSIRKRIAERLVQAQQSAAILTTFNEVDMSRVMALREKYQDRFVKKYGIKLGFMSFFVKAAVEALKAYPMANAEIRGESIAYKHYYHIGVAVSGPRGLVVPVVRHADRLSFAETEQAIAAFGEKAKKNQISVDELRGGTFTLSNGGIFGSMMSTPILNSPQVAILGMHAIQKRAVVVNDEIVIRPMMYLAVSYDHRLLDGREAVSFLVRIKECIEDPERLLLEV